MIIIAKLVNLHIKIKVKEKAKRQHAEIHLIQMKEVYPIVIQDRETGKKATNQKKVKQKKKGKGTEAEVEVEAAVPGVEIMKEKGKEEDPEGIEVEIIEEGHVQDLKMIVIKMIIKTIMRKEER